MAERFSFRWHKLRRMVTKVENLRGWAYKFIPDKIKAENKLETLVHAYIINGMLIGSMIMSLLGFLLSFFTTQNSFLTVFYGVGLTTFCIAFYYLSLRVFHKTASFVIAGNLYAASSFIGIFVAAFYTNGYDSPIIHMMLTIPIMVFMMSGRLVGTLWMVIVLAALAFMFYLNESGYEFKQIVDSNSSRRYISMVSWSILGVVMMLGLYVYDLINRNLASRLENERNYFAFQAGHDSLTQIANRATFEKVLRETIDQCKSQQGKKAVVVYIDLDDFKPINDEHGHQAGDYVLKAVAKRIKNAVRATDLTARLGGDEFAIILNGIEDTKDVHNILDNLVTQVSSPIRTNEAQVGVTCSVGAVMCPDHGTDPETLANYADELMYKAKEKKNSYLFAG